MKFKRRIYSKFTLQVTETRRYKPGRGAIIHDHGLSPSAIINGYAIADIYLGLLNLISIHKNHEEEHIKMQEEDRNRYKILIAGRKEVFGRLQEHIFNLSTKIITLISITLATLSIFLTLLIFLDRIGLLFLNVGVCFILVSIVFLFYSLFVSIRLIRPVNYKELTVFDNERSYKLEKMNEQELCDEAYNSLKVAYDHNLTLYNNRIILYTLALYCFIIAAIVFILYILKKIIDELLPSIDCSGTDIIFIGIVGAILYYFYTEYKSEKSEKK